MSAKYTLVSNATAGDRLLNVGQAQRQLSTGDTVMLVYDPSSSSPNQITLQLVTAASGHTATSVITALSTDNFIASGLPQALALDVDASDNIYVVGSDNSSGEGDQIGVQAFKKGSGLNWTTQPYITKSSSATDNGVLGGFAMAWVNSGGGTNGAGHLLVIINDTSSGETYALTVDAGQALAASKSGLIPYAKLNPAFLGGASVAAVAGSNLDIATEGAGGNSGLAAIAFDATHVLTGSWGLTSGGQITSGGGLSDTRIAGTMSTSTKVRVIWYAPGAYVTLFRSSAHAGQVTVNSYSTSAFLGTVDSGTASNFPAPSASLSWAVIAGPSANAQVWIFGWSSATASTMLRLPIGFNGAGVPSVGTVATDDTTLGTAGTTIRADPNPVDMLHADYQIYQSTTAFGLLGDFSSLNAAPNAPTLVAPANGTVAAIHTGGTLSWLFSSPVAGDVQSGFALRVQVNNGSYQWYRTSDNTLQAVETFNTTATQSAAIASGIFAAAAGVSWSVRTKGGGGTPQTGPYSSAFSFTVANPAPTTPTLTATYNATTNQTTLTLHSTDATGPTGSIEYSDDSGATWAFLRGSTALVIYPGTATIIDVEVPDTAIARQYRARSWTAAPQSFSAYATATSNPNLTGYWIVEPISQTMMLVNIKDGSYQSQPKKMAAAHYQLGGSLAKIEVGEVFGLEGQFIVLTRSETEDLALTALLALPNILLWQRPNIGMLYLFVTLDAAVDQPLTPTAVTSYREHTVNFIQTDRPPG
jgi:hypothetical protein